MSASRPKGLSPMLKPPTIGATAQKQQKNITIKPPNKPSKIITTPTKLNNQIAKQQSSPGTPLASDNAAAIHNTSAALSTLHNASIAKIPLTNVYELNSTAENQKIDQIDIPQSTISSPMLITSDETLPTRNIVTESSVHKQQDPPTTSLTASTSPLHPTSQKSNLSDPKHHHKKIKMIDQTTTSNNTPTNQVSPFTQSEITKKPENRSRSNSRKRLLKELDTHLDPISQIFNEHNHTSLNFPQFKHIIEIIATLDHPLETIHEYETTGNHILELLEKIRPSLLTVKAKNNITRITNKLFKAIDNEASIDASEAESDTY
ncbi:hypothetical protein QTP88_019813 [Uroleucon formosanum]